jgi:hypothetical protein
MRTEVTLKVLSAILSLGLLASPAAADTWLGGLDMHRACKEQYTSGGQGQQYWVADKKGEGRSDWACYSTLYSGQSFSIDINLACKNQHGGGYSYCTSGIYDWSCYVP